jgi:hypothetical protein
MTEMFCSFEVRHANFFGGGLPDHPEKAGFPQSSIVISSKSSIVFLRAAALIALDVQIVSNFPSRRIDLTRRIISVSLHDVFQPMRPIC